ncbi:MAG TPA: hypothetical protein VIL99_09895 [Ignavibacteria bacterium]
MTVRNNKKKSLSAATGILTGIKNKQQDDFVDETIDEVKEGDIETNVINEDVDTEGSSSIGIDNKDLFEQAKKLIVADTELIRRTFTIESITHTQLNELKIYIMPAVTGKKKWGYNEIVNHAVNEYYLKQKKILQDKVQVK